MKHLASALAALAIVGSLAVATPVVTASATLNGGASGCCKDFHGPDGPAGERRHVAAWRRTPIGSRPGRAARRRAARRGRRLWRRGASYVQ